MGTQKGQSLSPWPEQGDMVSLPTLVSAWPNPSQIIVCTCVAKVSQRFISGASPGTSSSGDGEAVKQCSKLKVKLDVVLHISALKWVLQSKKLNRSLTLPMSAQMLLEQPGCFWILLDVGWKSFLPSLMRLEMGEEMARRTKYFTCFDFSVHETIFSSFLAQVLSYSYYCCSCN